VHTNWSIAEATAGSELESYLRTLQATGKVRTTSWSVRAFTFAELQRLFPADSAHPWSHRVEGFRHRSSWLALVRPAMSVRYNSAYPLGGNEGGVWSGRGITIAARAGVAFRAGPLSARVAPVFFRAENKSFPLVPVLDSGVSPFSNPDFPTRIDLPQRFGDSPLTRLLPGESELYLEGGGFVAGVSTASEWWGPSSAYPFVLSNNSGGFPRIFAGSSHPLGIGIGRIHFRYLFGTLSQSSFFEPRGSLARRRRSANALVTTFEPRGLDGLEVGFSRFFHAPWPDGSLRTRDFTRVFETGLKSGIDTIPVDVGAGDIRSRDGENQLASVFLRWLVPNGLDLYAEIGREDHPWDARELMVLPDRQMSLGFGVRRTWAPKPGSLKTIRFEQLSYLQNSASRNSFGSSHITYVHNAGSNQGHTSGGMLLGANLAPGSASGAELAFETYSSRGRRTFALNRIVRRDQRSFWEGGIRNPRAYDTQYVASADWLAFLHSADVHASVYYMYNFNRDFGEDTGGFGVRLALTPAFPRS
jgi:hypothetical protein